MSGNKLTEQQKVEIVQKYNTGEYSCNQLAKEYLCTTPNISYILKKRGIVVKSVKNKLINKYSCNENYFDNIDNERKAYWLGFLYADGSVCGSARKEHISFVLQERDKYIIEEFAKDIQSNHPITFLPKKKESHQNHNGIYIYSTYLCKSLTKQGCYANKTYTLKFPTEEQVPSDLIHHFIRGMWDGDGHVSFYLNNGKMITHNKLVGTIDICLHIQCILVKNNIDCFVQWDKRTNKQIREIIVKQNSLIKFKQFLYKDATFYLKRKYDNILKYEEYMATRNKSA